VVKSLFINSYFENMKKWYSDQDFIFDNWNDTDLERRDDGMIPGKSLFYVPKNQTDHLVDFFVRYALTRSAKNPGEPWIYLGWNTTPINALDGTRSHIMHRRVPLDENTIVRAPEGIPKGSRQTKWFRESTFDLSVFMVTNQGNIAEDLEEVYEARIQMKSEYPVDMGSVFILDYPNFQVNTQHRTLQTMTPMWNRGNLWGLKYDVTITGPALEFDETQMAACKSVSVNLFEMTKNELVTEFSKNKDEN
jgi:hypothetical protein